VSYIKCFVVCAAEMSYMQDMFFLSSHSLYQHLF